jgi:RNA polymerase sigma-70 factor (ECF subfamily)
MRIEEIFRAEHGRILATLIRLLGDFDVAEEALQEAFAVAVEQWPVAGTPTNPASWLVSTARHKAIDRIRRRARLAQKQEEIAHHFELSAEEEDAPMPEDRLRLIFTCCHPALAIEAQVALTLRTLGGLSTEEIARAFWCPRRPWRSGSCVPRPRSAARAFPTRCLPTRHSPSGSRR